MQEVEHSSLKLFVSRLEQVKFVAPCRSHATSAHRYINFSVRPNRKQKLSVAAGFLLEAKFHFIDFEARMGTEGISDSMTNN